MQYNGYAKANTKMTLKQFANEFKTQSNATSIEERESVAYVDDHYFKIWDKDCEYKIAHVDDDEFDEYDYWIIASSKNGNETKENSIRHAKCVGQMLVNCGFKVCLGDWENGTNWVCFFKGDGRNGKVSI